MLNSQYHELIVNICCRFLDVPYRTLNESTPAYAPVEELATRLVVVGEEGERHGGVALHLSRLRLHEIGQEVHCVNRHERRRYTCGTNHAQCEQDSQGHLCGDSLSLADLHDVCTYNSDLDLFERGRFIPMTKCTNPKHDLSTIINYQKLPLIQK